MSEPGSIALTDAELERLWSEAVKDRPDILPSEIRQLIGSLQRARRTPAIGSPPGEREAALVTCDTSGNPHNLHHGICRNPRPAPAPPQAPPKEVPSE